jgi:hypothetical protein
MVWLMVLLYYCYSVPFLKILPVQHKKNITQFIFRLSTPGLFFDGLLAHREPHQQLIELLNPYGGDKYVLINHFYCISISGGEITSLAS